MCVGPAITYADVRVVVVSVTKTMLISDVLTSSGMRESWTGRPANNNFWTHSLALKEPCLTSLKLFGVSMGEHKEILPSSKSTESLISKAMETQGVLVKVSTIIA